LVPGAKAARATTTAPRTPPDASPHVSKRLVVLSRAPGSAPKTRLQKERIASPAASSRSSRRALRRKRKKTRYAAAAPTRPAVVSSATYIAGSKYADRPLVATRSTAIATVPRMTVAAIALRGRRRSIITACSLSPQASPPRGKVRAFPAKRNVTAINPFVRPASCVAGGSHRGG
jgi:hypothetical protein